VAVNIPEIENAQMPPPPGADGLLPLFPKTTVLPFILYDCEILTLTLRKKQFFFIFILRFLLCLYVIRACMSQLVS
jgi:hypothetical protein